MSNAWDDSAEDTREVYWESRIEVLYQYRFFDRLCCKGSTIQSFFESLDGLSDLNDSNGKNGKKSFWRMFTSFLKNVFWFILGLVTLGLFWPRQVRRKILWYGIE